jgi:uncharacterized membrane protein YbhN (UPF0104 family)
MSFQQEEQPPGMIPGPKRVWRSPYLWLGIAVSLVCLVLVLRQLDFAATWDALSQADYGLVALATGNIVLILAAKAARWRLLFYPSHRDQDYGSLLSALTASVLVNFALPLRLGDLMRVYLAGLADTSPLQALGTVAVEKLLDAIALAIMLVALLPVIDLPIWLLQPVWLLTVVALIGVMAGLILRERFLHGLRLLEGRIPLLSRLGASDRAGRVLEGLGALSRVSVLLKLGAWTALIWGLSFLTHWLVLRSMGLSVPPLTPLLLHTVLQAGVAVPSSPAKLGVFHGLCVWALSLFGVVGATAVSYSLLLYFVVWTPPTVLGTIFLWRSGRASEVLRLVTRNAESQNR